MGPSRGYCDPVLGSPRLQDAYFKRFSDYDRGITVPSLVDIESGEPATNDYRQLVREPITQGKDLKPAGTQESFDAAYADLWRALNWAEVRLGRQSYLAGFGNTTDFAEIISIESKARSHSSSQATRCPYDRLRKQLKHFGLKTPPLPIQRHIYRSVIKHLEAIYPLQIRYQPPPQSC